MFPREILEGKKLSREGPDEWTLLYRLIEKSYHDESMGHHDYHGHSHISG